MRPGVSLPAGVLKTGHGAPFVTSPWGQARDTPMSGACPDGYPIRGGWLGVGRVPRAWIFCTGSVNDSHVESAVSGSGKDKPAGSRKKKARARTSGRGAGRSAKVMRSTLASARIPRSLLPGMLPEGSRLENTGVCLAPADEIRAGQSCADKTGDQRRWGSFRPDQGQAVT